MFTNLELYFSSAHMAVLFNDLSFLICFIGWVIIVYTMVLFTVWWAKKGQALEIYKYVTFLVYGMFIDFSMQLYARSVNIYDIEHSTRLAPAYFTSDIWSYRHIVSVTMISIIAFRLTRRWFISARAVKGLIKNGDESRRID